MQDHRGKKRKAANASVAVSSAENEPPSALKRLQAIAAGAEKLWQEAVAARTPVSSATMIASVGYKQCPTVQLTHTGCCRLSLKANCKIKNGLRHANGQTTT